MLGRVTPRGVVLNVTRVAPTCSLPVRHLVEIGALFGFKGNAIRVAITRLVADGMLESDERGSYRIGSAAAALGTLVDRWRLGEARMRRWDGGWLVVALEPGRARKARRASLRALARLGLREGPGGLWLRPDNLATCLADTRQQLALLGLEDESEAFIGRDFGERFERRLRTDLWPVKALQAGHEQALQALERSLERLPSLARAAALVETYLLGGEAIRVLVADPLLPEEIMTRDLRRDLTERMLEYDAVGRRLWSEVASQPQLALVGGQHAG